MAMNAADVVQGMDNILGYLEGICDERDSVPLLLAVRDQWPLVKTEIERLRTEMRVCAQHNRPARPKHPRLYLKYRPSFFMSVF
jgi:hypothetical protein